MAEKRLTITEGMRKFLDYPRFVGRTRMLVLETEYFFDGSWIRAAQSLGWETATVPSVMTGGLTREQIADLFQTIGSFKPHFILTSNYAGMDEKGMFYGVASRGSMQPHGLGGAFVVTRSSVAFKTWRHGLGADYEVEIPFDLLVGLRKSNTFVALGPVARMGGVNHNDHGQGDHKQYD